MIKVPRLELKEFLRRISGVKDNILPICSYVKFDVNGENATLTKTNINSFVVHQVKCECDKPTTILIDQFDLSAFVNNSNAEIISIEVKGKNISISDGLTNGNIQTTSEPFPRIQERNNDEPPMVFVEDVLEAISLAVSHADKNKNGSPTEFVYVKKISAKESCVFAGDHFIIFFKKFHLVLPDLQLEPETATAIGKLRQAGYHKAKNYNVFDSGVSTYGFISVDSGTLNLLPVVEKLKMAETQFEIDRKELVNFCELITGVHQGALAPEIIIEGSASGIILSYESSDHHKTYERELNADNKKSAVDPFAFNPNLMLTVLKSVVSEKITFGRIGNSYVATTVEDPDWIGAIQGLDYSTIRTNKKQQHEAV